METMIESEAIKSIETKDQDEDGEPVRRQSEESSEEWAPWNLVLSTKNSNAPPPVTVQTPPGPVWDIAQVLKAAGLLLKPPLKVDFSDEQEMRCCYSLIYDVFRYKGILDQAIEGVAFFRDYPKFAEYRHAVWLFLMELARRRWGARPRSEMDRAIHLLDEAGSPFKDIENAIWEQRVHFAAAIARIRIKNKAFTLSDMLPQHLREERVSACVNKETVTGWVNTFKAKKVALLVKRLHELGYSYSGSKQLCSGEYRFDRVCPRFITLRPPENRSIGQTDLVRDGVIVLQEREFCEGASTLCRALRANSLHGAVAQTHASSPRCSAYLAAQLKELASVLKAKTTTGPITPELGRLVIFGAGDKANSYVSALRDLGIEASEAPHTDAAVCVLSDAVYCDTPLVATALDGVVAVLATPPNSYSAVTDPIDLVCGRGGDLAMLEILTESEMDSNGKARVQSILEEQKKTLKTLMSKPQIQLILYETHSALEAENQVQVTRAVAEANRLARERHSLLRKKHRSAASLKPKDPMDGLTSDSSSSLETGVPQESPRSIIEELPDTESSLTADGISIERPRSAVADSVLKKSMDSIDLRPQSGKARPIPMMQVPEEDPVLGDPDKDNPDVYVPSCDLFETCMLPNLGNGLDINYILERDGCYLGLIQRKEITRLDAKYMIRVAEERGLFGGKACPAHAPRRKRKDDKGSPKRGRRKGNCFEVERVAAPTYASITRAARPRRLSAPGSLSPEPACTGAPVVHVCSRHARRQAAASAITAAACTCDARHKNRSRRASADVQVARPPAPACRKPFPLVVHDLRLKAALHQKITAL